MIKGSFWDGIKLILEVDEDSCVAYLHFCYEEIDVWWMICLN
jgi:hypothetical protein